MKGLEVHFHLIKDTFRSKEDALVAAVHCFLINQDFKCVGLGEWDQSAANAGSEMLPENWNNNQEVYMLKYVGKTGTRYFLKVARVGDICLVNVMNMETQIITGTSVRTDDFIGSLGGGNVHSIYPNVDVLERQFSEELLSKSSGEAASSTKKQHPIPENPDPDPLRVPRPSRMQRPPSPDGWRNDPFNYGGRDLDPFGGFGRGGGMIFDPRAPRAPPYDPRFPRPPGARFDPTRPPRPDPTPRFRGRDPDNILHRDFDDMFS